MSTYLFSLIMLCIRRLYMVILPHDVSVVGFKPPYLRTLLHSSLRYCIKFHEGYHPHLTTKSYSGFLPTKAMPTEVWQLSNQLMFESFTVGKNSAHLLEAKKVWIFLDTVLNIQLKRQVNFIARI